ncbi:MAG: DNA-processing protein DprA [Clostridia bacterium]|nr:DNA-processing protein DprA [Clostridia bacterium]
MGQHLIHWVWLNSVPGIGARRASQLLEYFECPENIWNARKEELSRLPFLTRKTIENLMDKKIRDESEKHLERIYNHKIKVITIKDDLYPCYLKSIYDAPPLLFVKGQVEKDEKTIAIVGSRRATSYGLDMAERIGYELSKLGVTVVSGMARGIDSRAHSGSLKAGGRTLAVLGCGLDTVYPPENKPLMQRIEESGAVISEYLPGVKPVAQNFPARNRIISGISLGVVIIEANEKSGSLITADFALEQGREVFAVPGNITSSNSKGTNKLIREGAKIVTDIDDILEEIKVHRSSNNKEHRLVVKKPQFDGLDSDERIIAEQLSIEPTHIDLLAEKSKINIQEMNAILIMMELRGIVEQLPGKIFKLKE